MARFGPKKSKLSVLPENWYTWYVEDADSFLTLVFWLSNPKSIFGQIWTKKVKVIRFARKLAHMVSRGCWFLFQHLFSEFPILNLFLGKFGPKKSKLSVLSENWHAWYLEDTDSYSEFNFLNFKLKFIFGQS